MRGKANQHKAVAAVVAVALLGTCAPATGIEAAKAPKLSKTKITIQKGKSTKITLKNGEKSAKVSWKTSDKKVVKISAKSTKGNKAYAKLVAVKKGTAKITVTYTKKKVVKKMIVKVIVKDAGEVTTKPEETTANTTMPDSTTAAPAQETQATTAESSPSVAPTTEVTATPTEETAVPSLKPTITPIYRETPEPFSNLYPLDDMPDMEECPNVLRFIDGSVASAGDWGYRAEEIRQMYQYYMYGMWRDGKGETVSYETSDNKITTKVKTDGSVQGQVKDGEVSFDVTIDVPMGEVPDGGWPVIVAMGGLGDEVTKVALDNGIAVIRYDTAAVSQDSKAFQGAFYDLYPYNKEEWKEQTGVLMAWAWGASKVLDSLQAGAAKEYQVNPEFVMVSGVSRWGKATAVAGAFDTRFKIALPTCSGAGGMGVFRYNPAGKVTQTYDISSLGYGETVTYKSGDCETIKILQTPDENYWFNENFKKLHIDSMPFDQYFLSSLYAMEGRSLMLIGGFNWDTWQNTPSLWFNFQMAKPVFDMMGVSNNIIIHLHDTSMGHAVVESDVEALGKYIQEMYYGKDVEGFEISDLQTTLFDLEETPAGINNKAIYEAQIPELQP